jgi:hypothetical protein
MKWRSRTPAKRPAPLALLLLLAAPTQVLAQEVGDVSPAAYSDAAWSPYLVGALIGVLSMLTFYFSNRPIGASGAYAKGAGLLGRLLAKRHTLARKYYRENPPKVDWEFVLVVGIVAGAWLAAWSGGEITGRWLPPMWVERFGELVWLRVAVAFLGGGTMAFGARLAGGCTSGHGISGTLQLSVGSWIALICFFIGGVTTALLIYRL